jgi:putative peptidoglycan lipid II flippase
MQSIQLLRTNLANWLNGSVNRKIFRAALTVGVMTLLVKGVGFAKSLVVAHQFGTSDELDAFYIAWILPSMAISVIASALNSAFVPTYVQLQELEDQRITQRLLGNVMFCGIGLLLGCSILLGSAAPYVLPLLGGAFSPEKLLLTERLFFILIFVLCIKGVSTIWAGVLNSGHRFALASITPSIVPATSMIALLLMEGTWDIYAFTCGTVIGFVLEACILAWQLKRFNIPIKPYWSGIDEPMRQVIGQYGAGVVAAFLMANANLVDQGMAAMLEPGSVAVLNYASTISDTLLLIGSFALGTAVLPYFSEMVSKSNWDDVRSTISIYTRIVFIVTLPVVLFMFLFSDFIIAIIFQRGAFTSADTQMVSEVQVMFVLQIPFYILSIFSVKLLSSLKKNMVLVWGSAMSLILNILFNIIFFYFFGLKGIALSTSFVYFFSWIYLTLAVRRAIKTQESLKFE